jgi:hypothetical protein
VTDARWIDVEDDVAAAACHFHNAGRLFDAGGFDDDDLKGYRARMALQHAMQAAHTSLEAALTRILDILGEDAPTGPSSHADFVRRVAKSLDLPDRKRPAILPHTLVVDVDETRRSRHRATHDYNNFMPHLASPSIEAAKRIAISLPDCIRDFKDAVDPPSSMPGCGA